VLGVVGVGELRGPIGVEVEDVRGEVELGRRSIATAARIFGA